MALNSRAKGSRGELELAHWLTERGHPAHRSQQYCGRSGDADLQCPSLVAYHIEVKRVEAGNPYVWLDQAINDSADTGRVPTVFHRKNNRDWMVIMRAEDFLKLAA